MRAFIAVHPTAKVIDKLAELREQLGDDLPDSAVRWSEQVHLTTQFLGNTDDSRVSEFVEALRAGCATVKAFNLCCAGIGCFPTARQPRVIWAGLSGDIETLQLLKESLDKRLEPLGYIAEKRAFKPHLTIARVRELNTRQRQAMPKLVERFQNTEFGEWRVDRVELMQSVLSPKGAQYKVIECVKL